MIKKRMQKGPPVFFKMESLNFGEQPRPCNWNGIGQPRKTTVNDGNSN
jgi:hypothetical protein